MAKLSAVIRTRELAWNHALPLEQQQNWGGHAKFMEALHAEGFVALGGPLEGTSDVLLIIRAKGCPRDPRASFRRFLDRQRLSLRKAHWAPHEENRKSEVENGEERVAQDPPLRKPELQG